MRLLSTIIMSISLAGAGCSAEADNVQTAQSGIWNKPPLELLNRDILALPKAERKAFIHGSVVQLIQVHSEKTQGHGKCLTDWYFHVGDGKKAVLLAMEKYPDYPTVTAIGALARRACPAIKG